MALGVMGYNRSAIDDGVEILYNSEYVGDAVTLDDTAFTDGVCLAGTPISNAGVIANDGTAYGILLYDVYEDRPQGTVVIGGYINTDVAEDHSGVTYDDLAKSALKNVVFH